MTPPKILPPHYFLLAILSMCAVSYADSSVVLPGRWYLLGLIPVALGLWSAAWAARQFSKAETNIVPLTHSTALVTDGMFAFTRNPMYVGMIAVLAGTAILLNGWLAWLVIVVFAALIRTLFVRREERLMEETFGDEYLAYKSRVRRWL